MNDLLNEFALEITKRKHLGCYTSLVNRARPYSFDDDAVDFITEIASGYNIGDKLSIYRRLGRLPFDVVWFEFDYTARFRALCEHSSLSGPMPKDAPIRMGWLIQKLTDISWRSVNVVMYNPDHTASGRSIDTFGIAHVLATEGKLTNFKSVIQDASIRQAVMEMNETDEIFNGEDGVSMCQAIAWGFGKNNLDGSMTISMPRHLDNTNAVDLPKSWEPIIQRVGDGMPSRMIKETKTHMLNSAKEIQGDLRFLVAALATINNAPMIYEDFRRPGTRKIGGNLKPYMVNRIVRIGVPKSRGRVAKIMKELRLAERAMRRHEVSGYWKNVRSGPGRKTVTKKWVDSYWRGDASLGFVNQQREVFKD